MPEQNSPLYFFHHGFILITHVICLGQDRVSKEGIGFKVEVKFEALGVIYFRPLDVFKIFETLFITISNLILEDKRENNEGFYTQVKTS